LALQRSYNLVVGMTGDGVNDAPALSAAQCGIAVDDATDAAKNAAAMILTTEGLSAVFGAVVESRKIFARLFSYVSYRLASTIQILLYLSILVYFFDCTLDPLYVILLALLNDVTMLPIAEDRQTASAEPEHAEIGTVIGFSTMLGVMQSFVSLVFYFLMDRGLVKGIGSHVEHGWPKDVHAQNAIWLQVSIAAEFLIFTARAPGLFFFSRPSTELIFSTMAGNVLATLLAIYAFEDPLDWEEVARIWLFDLAALFLVDWVKMIYKFIFKHNSAGIIDEAAIAAEDAAEKKPDDEGEPVANFEQSIAKQRASVRLVADRASVRAKRKEASKSMVFLAEGKSRPSATSATFRSTQAKSVRVTGAKSVRTESLHKMTPGAVARHSSVVG